VIKTLADGTTVGLVELLDGYFPVSDTGVQRLPARHLSSGLHFITCKNSGQHKNGQTYTGDSAVYPAFDSNVSYRGHKLTPG
jgi:hypothetical protein